jgi:hypothetical protein
MTVPAQCSNCWYGQTTSGGGQAGTAAVRLCRFNAPLVSHPADGSQPKATWPAVLDTDWCGEGIANTTGVPFGLAAAGSAPGAASF